MGRVRCEWNIHLDAPMQFRTQGWKDPKQGADNIANTLEEGVKWIDTWFEECINGLRAE